MALGVRIRMVEAGAGSSTRGRGLISIEGDCQVGKSDKAEETEGAAAVSGSVAALPECEPANSSARAAMVNNIGPVQPKCRMEDFTTASAWA